MTNQASAAAPRDAAGPAEHYLAEHAAMAERLPGIGLDWLRALRERALAQFAATGFPGPRDEHWKYTRVAPIEKRRFRPLAAAPALSFDELLPFRFADVDCDLMVFVNGRFAADLSRVGALPEGARIASLAEVLAADPESLRPHLGRHAEAAANGFAALNAAFMSDGAVIHLQPNTRLERPVHLLYLATSEAPDGLHQPRNLVIAGDGSQARIVESYACTGDGTYLTNAVSEVVLAANAQVEHYAIQQEGLKAFHVAALQVYQARDSRFVSHAVAFGGQIARQDIRALLDGEGAECTLNGLYMVGGRQHVDFHTTVDHARPHGTSHEYYKGILDGRSRGVFNGRVHVHPQAQKTDSEQSNKNLLLSRHAEVDTKPELEIYADDVKCSHGATVGQLDEDMLFYLRARGIDKEAARGLLTYGFAQDVIDRMSIPAVRDRLEEVLVNRVPDAEHVRAMV